jgi:hypothetical protein
MNFEEYELCTDSILIHAYNNNEAQYVSICQRKSAFFYHPLAHLESFIHSTNSLCVVQTRHKYKLADLRSNLGDKRKYLKRILPGCPCTEKTLNSFVQKKEERFLLKFGLQWSEALKWSYVFAHYLKEQGFDGWISYVEPIEEKLMIDKHNNIELFIWKLNDDDINQ